MNCPTNRERLSSKLRTLVAERHFPEAQAALSEYCAAVRLAAACLPPSDPRRRQLQAETAQLLEETRRRVLEMRAHSAARLARLAPSPRARYYQAVPPQTTWESMA
jgi:hypothetical protein